MDEMKRESAVLSGTRLESQLSGRLEKCDLQKLLGARSPSGSYVGLEVL